MHFRRRSRHKGREASRDVNKALSAMGLARRAGKLQWGFETAAEAMRDGKCRLLVTAEDLSDKTRKNVRYEAARFETPLIESTCTMEEIGRAIGKKAGVVAVLDDGFARLLLRELGSAGEREESLI